MYDLYYVPQMVNSAIFRNTYDCQYFLSTTTWYAQEVIEYNNFFHKKTGFEYQF